MSKLIATLLFTILVAFTVVTAEEVTATEPDVPGQEPNYRLVVHLYRPLRRNLFGKPVNGTLTVKVTVQNVEYTENVDINHNVVRRSLPLLRKKLRIDQYVNETTTASVSFNGEGDGYLTVSRVTLLPLERGVIEIYRKAYCANFRGVNLLEVEGSVRKTLSRRGCFGVPGGR